MNTGIIIQARRSSTRLKDKIIMKLPSTSNISMLGRVIMRSKMACDNVILATSDLAEDDLTAEEAIKYGAKVYRGSLDDVLFVTDAKGSGIVGFAGLREIFVNDVPSGLFILFLIRRAETLKLGSSRLQLIIRRHKYANGSHLVNNVP